jgi:predicted O-methyltransferase YrrM
MRSPYENSQSEYLEKLISGIEPYENQSRLAAQKFNLAGISLSRGEAQVLRWFVQSKPVIKAVEIGTLTGLSGLYILDGLATGGALWTLEKSEEHANSAEPILKEFALKKGKLIHLVRGDARETLNQIKTNGPFDFIFIDGNKAAYGDYLRWAEENLRSGGLLVADNVFLSGAVYSKQESKFSEKQINVLNSFNKRLMEPSVWRSALLPTSEGLFVAEKI